MRTREAHAAAPQAPHTAWPGVSGMVPARRSDAVSLRRDSPLVPVPGGGGGRLRANYPCPPPPPLGAFGPIRPTWTPPPNRPSRTPPPPMPNSPPQAPPRPPPPIRPSHAPPPPPPPPPRGLRPTVSWGGSWRPEPRGRPPLGFPWCPSIRASGASGTAFVWQFAGTTIPSELGDPNVRPALEGGGPRPLFGGSL